MEIVHQKIRLRADTSQLAELRAFIKDVCAQHHVNRETMNRVVLAVDEAVANVIEHSDTPRGAPIEVSVDMGAEEITIEIRDRGKAFDPRACEVVPPEKRKDSKRGFGLYLIHLITNKVEYQRTGEGENVLTLTLQSS